MRYLFEIEQTMFDDERKAFEEENERVMKQGGEARQWRPVHTHVILDVGEPGQAATGAQLRGAVEAYLLDQSAESQGFTRNIKIPSVPRPARVAVFPALTEFNLDFEVRGR